MLYNLTKPESQIVTKKFKEEIAYCTDDYLDIEQYSKYPELPAFFDEQSILDIAVVNIIGKDGIKASKAIRNEYEMSEMILVADLSISPMEYMVPEIRAASLLLRPFTKEQGDQTIHNFFSSFSRRFEKEEEMIVIRNKGEQTRIPLSKVYYIEVRSKVVYIRLKNEEYQQAGTLDQMLSSTEDTFIRCHRSFAVNKSKIAKVQLSQNTIILEDDIEVPLSRSYKQEIKEFFIKNVR